MTRDIQGQNHTGKGGSPQTKPQTHHGSAVPPLPHVSSHEPKRYKATGTARVCGVPGKSAHSHQKDASVSRPAKLHAPLIAGGSKARGVVSLKKSKFTVSSGGHTDRSHVPLIVLCALVALIGAGVGWMCFLRPVHITVNDQAKQVRIGTSLETYLVDNNYFDVQPGKLLSVGGNVIDERGGDRCSVSVNGKEVKPADVASLKLEDGNAITVGDGADVTEEHSEETVTMAPGIQMEKGGAIQFVSQWGKAGKKKVTVKIKKASVSGYEIKYATNKNFKNAKTKNTTKTTYTIKSLKSKKKCYVKVRAYKVVKGKKIYGSYSKVLKATVK